MTEDSSTHPRAIFLDPNDGCLTMARVLVRRGCDVHLLAAAANSHMLTSRGVHGKVMPDPRGDSQAWLDAMRCLADSGGGVVICGSDAASEWVSANRSALPDSIRTFESADGVHTALMDKYELYKLAAEIGVRAPWMHRISTHTELQAIDSAVTYPCVLKGALGHRARAILGHGTVQVDSRDELMTMADALLENQVAFLLTELVPGDETALEGAVTVRGRGGDYPLEYGRHKLRQWPPDYGVGSLTSSKSVPGTLAMNRRILDHVGYFGVSSCETKRHAGTGELYLIEINVRVPGSFGVAEACGVDGSWRLYATAAGIPLGPQPAQVDGRHSMLPDIEWLAVRARTSSHDQTWGEVLRSWRGTRDFGIVSLRDPRPALSMLGTMVRRRVSRIAREQWMRLRGRPAATTVETTPVARITPERDTRRRSA